MAEIFIELGMCADRTYTIQVSPAFEELLQHLDKRGRAWKLSKARLELVSQICGLAKRSAEVFHLVGGDQWVRTVIYIKDPSIFEKEGTCKALASNERALLAAVDIRSNVIPGDKLHGTWYSFTLLEEAIEQKKPLATYLEEMRKEDVECQLSLQLEAIRREEEGGLGHNLLQVQARDLVTVGEKLAAGKEGAVFKVVWQGLGFFVKKDFFCPTAYARDFEKANKVSHPNLVSTIGFCSSKKPGSILMEMLDATLSDELEKGPFQMKDAFDVVLQIANGMEHLHEMDWTIGDLTLDNILIMQLGPHYIVKVADYGGFSSGESPKVVDIESFGGTAIQVLAGHVGAEEISVELDYPEDLTALITACCENAHELDFSSSCFDLRRIRDEWLN